jgi:hypothetical protein
MMQTHHDVAMRTTIDLPEDLHRIALAIARDTGRSLSQTVAELVRRGLAAPEALRDHDAPAYTVDAATGLPRVRSKRLISAEDVRRVDDEA